MYVGTNQKERSSDSMFSLFESNTHIPASSMTLSGVAVWWWMKTSITQTLCSRVLDVQPLVCKVKVRKKVKTISAIIAETLFPSPTFKLTL